MKNVFVIAGTAIIGAEGLVAAAAAAAAAATLFKASFIRAASAASLIEAGGWLNR